MVLHRCSWEESTIHMCPCLCTLLCASLREIWNWNCWVPKLIVSCVHHELIFVSSKYDYADLKILLRSIQWDFQESVLKCVLLITIVAITIVGKNLTGYMKSRCMERSRNSSRDLVPRIAVTVIYTGCFTVWSPLASSLYNLCTCQNKTSQWKGELCVPASQISGSSSATDSCKRWNK